MVLNLVDDPAFVTVTIVRLVLGATGFLIMLGYKVVMGVQRGRTLLNAREHKLGVPVGWGVRTVLGIASFVWNSPRRGVWLVAHVLSMASTCVSNVWLAVQIVKNGFDHSSGVEPGTDQAARSAFYEGLMWSFDIGVLLLCLLFVLQLGLVLTGQYVPHRWLGRVCVHLVVWTSLCALFTASAFSTTVLLITAVCLEVVVFFGYKISRESGNVVVEADGTLSWNNAKGHTVFQITHNAHLAIGGTPGSAARVGGAAAAPDAAVLLLKDGGAASPSQVPRPAAVAVVDAPMTTTTGMTVSVPVSAGGGSAGDGGFGTAAWTTGGSVTSMHGVDVTGSMPTSGGDAAAAAAAAARMELVTIRTQP